MIDLDGTAEQGQARRQRHRRRVDGAGPCARRVRETCRCGSGSPRTALRPSLPVPHFNVLNGGVHAPNDLDFQEFMIAPLGAPSMAEAVRAGAEVYAALRRELASRKLSTGLGDEGGFAPEISEPEEVLRLLVQAISDAGYTAGPRGRVHRAGPGRLGVPAARRALPGGGRPAGQRGS